MSKMFSKYVAIAVILVLLLATGIKIDSVLTGSPGHDRNFNSLRSVDRSSNEFSFAVFGDNQNSITVFNDLIDKVNADDVSFAFANGDMVVDGEMEKYRFFTGQVKKLNKPLLTAIGNHELYANGRGNYYEILGPFYYSFTVGQSYFIVLDDADGKRLDPWQTRWLESELEQSRAFKYRFVFMHVPLYDTRTEGFGLNHDMKNKAAARSLNAMFDRYDVTMLFSSHIHEYDRGVWGKTPYLITGGAGGTLAGTDPAHYFFHYIRVNVNDSGVKYDVVKLRSPGYTLLDRLVYDTWLYVYAYLATHYLDIVMVVSMLYLLGFALYWLEKKGRLRRRRKQKEARD